MKNLITQSELLNDGFEKFKYAGEFLFIGTAVVYIDKGDDDIVKFHDGSKYLRFIMSQKDITVFFKGDLDMIRLSGKTEFDIKIVSERFDFDGGGLATVLQDVLSTLIEIKDRQKVELDFARQCCETTNNNLVKILDALKKDDVVPPAEPLLIESILSADGSYFKVTNIDEIHAKFGKGGHFFDATNNILYDGTIDGFDYSDGLHFGRIAGERVLYYQLNGKNIELTKTPMSDNGGIYIDSLVLGDNNLDYSGRIYSTASSFEHYLNGVLIDVSNLSGGGFKNYSFNFSRKLSSISLVSGENILRLYDGINEALRSFDNDLPLVYQINGLPIPMFGFNGSPGQTLNVKFRLFNPYVSADNVYMVLLDDSSVKAILSVYKIPRYTTLTDAVEWTDVPVSSTIMVAEFTNAPSVGDVVDGGNAISYSVLSHDFNMEILVGSFQLALS